MSPSAIPPWLDAALDAATGTPLGRLAWLKHADARTEALASLTTSTTPPPLPARVRAHFPDLTRLPLDILASLWPHLTLRTLEPGEVLVAEGAPADAVYLIATGSVEIEKQDPTRGVVVLGHLRAGAVVGEMAVVLRQARTATARASEQTVVLRLEVGALERAAAASPVLAAALSSFARQRIVEQLLLTSALFRNLGSDARAALAEAFTSREMPAGTTITKQGGQGRALRVVLQGEVEVWRAEPADAPPQRIATLGPGQVFGEIALLTGQPATATVVSPAGVTALELQREALDALCDRHPDIAEALRDTAESRLAENRFIFQDDDFFEDAE